MLTTKPFTGPFERYHGLIHTVPEARVLVVQADKESDIHAWVKVKGPDMKTLNASCLCGGVKFQLLESPRRYYQCHCSLCRKQSGTSSNAATIVRSSQLEWNEGLTLIERFQKPTGFTSHFCRQCGSPLPNPLGNGAYTWVPLGLLDDPARVELALHLFTRSAAEWEAAPGVGLGFEEMPSLPEVLSLLHGSSEPA